MFRPFALLCLALAACERPPQGLADLGAAADGSLGGADLGQARGSGFLRVEALDDESGLPMPARVVVTAVPPTAPLRLDVDPQGNLVNGEYGVSLGPGVLAVPEGVMLVAGDGAWRMPAGTYDVMVNRGPEWEADTRRVTITDRTNVTVSVSLRHSVDTGGWLSADLHVHTGRSFDSKLPVTDRVVSMVVSGVELIVTTDHNVLSDLQPDVELYGYHDLARAIVGDEFNFFEGHGGAYPMPYDGTMPFGGTEEFKLDWPAVKDIHSGQIFDWLHTFPTKPAVSVNHPYWPTTDLGYFTNLGWSPPTPLADAGRFDGLELLSGYLMTQDYIKVLLRYWFFLLNSGVKVTALGSSDTHRLRDVTSGYARSWLRLPTDSPPKVLDSDLADAIKAQRAIASNGPFVLLTVDGAQIGDTVTNTSGTVTIEATVDAPGWIDVDAVRLYVNGKLAQTFPVAPGLRPLFHARWNQPVPAGDAWIALEAAGSKPLPTALIGEHSGGAVTPFAITNPVFLDGDGDQLWRPNIVEKDVGDVGPVGAPPPWLREPLDHPAPVDCEPPLWMEPSQWVNP